MVDPVTPGVAVLAAVAEPGEAGEDVTAGFVSSGAAAALDPMF